MTDVKDLENMTEKELLCELLKTNRKAEEWQRIASVAVLGLMLIVATGAMFVTVTLSGVVAKLNTTVDNANALIVSGQESLRGVDTMVSNVNTVVEDNTQQVNDAVNNFNSVDFDSLNSAIEDLAEVVEPLAEFTERFG